MGEPGGWIASNAFVTFLIRNDSYLPGALVVAHRLRKMGTKGELVCLVTPDITKQALYALEQLYTHVIKIDYIYVHHSRRQERQDRPYLFTRFAALRLGADGDLGTAYDKVAVLDSDIMPIADYDALFGLKAPAGIINEKKEHCIDASGSKRHEGGKWIWHEIYDPVCPHGAPIPKHITDRVLADPGNMGVNACLWVLEPSMAEYQRLLDSLKDESMAELAAGFSWPEMQYATAFWSGGWTSVDIRYCSFAGYPDLSVLCGTHYAGLKPWDIHKMASVSHYHKYDDFKLWYSEFVEMMTRNPQLKKVPRLQKLMDAYFTKVRAKGS